MFPEIPENHQQVLSLISDLSRAVRCCQQEAVFCENVTFTQFFILDVVAKGGRLRLSDLRKLLSVEKSTTTRLVDPLVRQGLVIREKASHDSRVVNLKLTKEGESVRAKVWQCLLPFVDAIERKIPKEERAQVYKAVRVFLNATQQACCAGKCQV